MARRKRSARPSGDPSQPNKTLVILLVLFFLSTAGLGGWVYSMFNDRYKYEEAAKKAEKEKNRLEADLVFAQGTTYLWRAMMGDKTMQNEESEDYKTLKEFLRTLVEERYPPIEAKEKAGQDEAKAVELTKDELQVKAIVDLLKASKEDLPFNDKSYMYEKKYPEVIAQLKLDLKKALIDGKGNLPAKEFAETELASLDKKYKAKHEEAFKAIEDGNTKSFAKAVAAYKKAEENIQSYLALLNAKTSEEAKLNKKLGDQDREIKSLKQRLEEQGVIVGDGSAPPALTKKNEIKSGGTMNYAGSPHALMLDISRGKPLWDTPRGKIVRVDDKGLRVHIDKGSEHGIQTQMTFNVFGAGWDNRAEKMLKGTVEVIRVDAKSSLARITSLYDSEGREIALGDQGTGKLLREASNPIKEGDLLFNLAWGSHVAIAGVIDWNGQGSETEAGLVEDLEQFRNLLKAQGVIVDAYVDMRDGKIYGNMTPRTNYLIRGYGFSDLDKKQLAIPRIAAINESIGIMRKEALERGVFVISPENFAMVIGYRRPVSAISSSLLDFRPSLPAGGTIGGVMPK